MYNTRNKHLVHIHNPSWYYMTNPSSLLWRQEALPGSRYKGQVMYGGSTTGSGQIACTEEFALSQVGLLVWDGFWSWDCFSRRRLQNQLLCWYDRLAGGASTHLCFGHVVVTRVKILLLQKIYICLYIILIYGPP